MVDLESEYLLSADVVHGTDSDSQTLAPSVVLAQINLVRAGSEAEIQEVAAAEGYHANQTLVDCEELEIRTYIPERETGHRRWTDKEPQTEQAFRNNRRRVRRDKGKRLQRLRSELLERSFALVCETGGARRTWLRGLEKINKRYQIHTAARNLGLLMRDLFGIGKPRVLQAGLEGLCLTDLHARWMFTHRRAARLRWNRHDRLTARRCAATAAA